MQRQLLDDWREAVAAPEGEQLLKVIEVMEERGLRIGAADLKRVPIGFDKDHPNEKLLRRNGFSVWMDFDDARLAYGNKDVTTILAGYQTLRPVFDGILELQKL